LELLRAPAWFRHHNRSSEPPVRLRSQRSDLFERNALHHCFYRPAGGTLVSTNGGSVWRGVVRSFMGCSLMRPGALGALALLPAVAASRFNRLLIT
jgi:hypothetical protein